MAITTVELIYEGVLMFNYVPHHNDVWSSILPHILGTFIYLQRLLTQFVKSVNVCLSTCISSTTHRTDFCEILYLTLL